jgi:hypothetical protein
MEMTYIAKKRDKNNYSKYDFTDKVPKTFTLIVHSPFSTGFFLHRNQKLKEFDERMDYNFLKDFTNSQNLDKKTNFFSIGTDDKDKFEGKVNNTIKFDLKLDKVFKRNSYANVEELLEWKHIKNCITITQFGIGIISMEIEVAINKIDISIIKQLDKRIEIEIKAILEIIKDAIKFDKKEYSSENKRSLDYYDTLKLKTFNVCDYFWHHTIYWFTDDNLLEVIDDQCSDIGRFFNTLLDQDINEKRYLLDRYIFLGWTKSLIITDHDKIKCENWFRERLKLLEIIQFVYLGLKLLDFSLSEHYEGKTILIDKKKTIKENIKIFNNFKKIFKEHLDHLYQGINLVRYKEFPFYTKIEKQWGLLELGNQIKNKIEYLEDDLKSKQNSISNHNQERLNFIIFIFTVISIAGVIGAIFGLEPTKDMFEKGTMPHFQNPNDIIQFINMIFGIELIWPIIITIISFSVIWYFILKRNEENNQMKNETLDL